MRRPIAIAMLAGSFALPGALLWSCGGKLPGPQVCSGRHPCGPGRACVLGRCRKNKTMPISTKASRLEFQPADLAWITAEGAAGPSEIGDKIVLGKRGDNSALLLLRFTVSWPEDKRLQRALLLLDPLPECSRRPGRVALEVAHVLSPWHSSQLSGGRLPRLGVPMLAGTATATPARPARLDITELVAAWQKHRKRYFGLALSASGDSATGACYTSGVSWGQGPRLHIYLWPEKPDAGADADAGDADAADAADADADGGDADS